MDSGSGNNQHSPESVDSLRQREQSSSSDAAADDAESPPVPPPSEITEVEGHGPPEAGGRKTAEQKGKAVQKAEDEATSLFWSAWGSAGDKPAALPPRAPTGGKPPLPPLPPEGQSSPGIDLKGVFDELMLESQAEKRTGEPEQKDEAEGMPPKQLLISEQAKSLALLPKKGKKPLLRKVLDKIGVSNRKYTLATSANVNYQKVHITELIRHYNLLEMVAGRGVEFHTNALNLRNAYFAFRPVLGDGECFYRSFIFSYLEQVLDRQDTHEEHRVLAAVKGVARQHAGLGWASEFPRSHKDMHHCFIVVA